MEFELNRTELANRNWNNPNCRSSVESWHNASRSFDYQYMFQWLGMPIIQDPQDICMIQELIWRIKPDVVIETGIARGGSLVLSASILSTLCYGELLRGETASSRKVIGIDIDIRDNNRKAIESHPLSTMISTIQGSSIDPSVISQVKSQLRDHDRILVILDSNHTRDHVFNELLLYSPFVVPGSAILVLDTGIEYAPVDTFSVSRPWGPGNSPLTAVNEFLNTSFGKDFEKDRSIEQRLLLSCAPEGLLYRKYS